MIQLKFWLFGVCFTIALVLSLNYFITQYEYSKRSHGASGSFAPASPHRASVGAELGLKSDQAVKVVDASYFEKMIAAAYAHPRKRKMTDLTKDPEKNSMQILINTWTEGSYSPVHNHPLYSEAFVVMEGALAFFVFKKDGTEATCHILSSDTKWSNKKAIVVEADEWHGMTAAPKALGYPGTAIIFEISGHVYSTDSKTKQLAPFAPFLNEGLDGEPKHFTETLLPLCAKAPGAVV